jgi:hypothetical protein
MEKVEPKPVKQYYDLIQDSKLLYFEITKEDEESA